MIKKGGRAKIWERIGGSANLQDSRDQDIYTGSVNKLTFEENYRHKKTQLLHF